MKNIKKKNFEENIFVGFEFLPAKPTHNSIEVFHPFANLANEYFLHQGYDISLQPSGSIKISFESLNTKEKILLANEIKEFLKTTRQKIINNFLTCKNGICYL